VRMELNDGKGEPFLSSVTLLKSGIAQATQVELV
jgi:hypothetical protein